VIDPSSRSVRGGARLGRAIRSEPGCHASR
jgi:hypothetical protein